MENVNQPKLNDCIQRVQIGRDKDVPVKSNTDLWFLWVCNDGSWDADTVSNEKEVIQALSNPKVINVFCVWHGTRRTNLFLMDKALLIKRLESRR